MSFLSNNDFDSLLKPEFRQHSLVHWTPFNIVKKCSLWLNSQNAKNTLDIGSGVGKFCFINQEYSSGQYTGIELRPSLVEESNRLLKELKSDRVNFIQSNILEFDFTPFDSFFYYNPFCEQEATSGFIDKIIEIKPELFEQYSNYVWSQLDKLPNGTLLITYRSPSFHPPEKFKVIDIQENGELVFWKI